MPALLSTFSNAKKSFELLQTFPLDLETKNNIRKLREILSDEPQNHPQIKMAEASRQNQRVNSEEKEESGEDGREGSNCLEHVDEAILGVGEENKQERESFLQRIVEEIQQLLLEGDIAGEERTNDSHLKQNVHSPPSAFSSEAYSLLLKISRQIKGIIAPQENTSSCSSQPTSNSHSGSVRSLLTEKLRQFAGEEADDPEARQERVVIQGNLMRELSKYSRGSKPMVVSRRFEDLSQPFSLQHKLGSDRELQNWPRREQKGRTHSQRTILGEINLADPHLREKRARNSESGCARCEIY